MGGKSDAPAAPNYEQLAQQQGNISSSLLNQQTTANRPDTTTPFGSTAWNYTPANPVTGAQASWSGSQTLSPEMQGLLNQQEQAAGSSLTNANASQTAGGNLFNSDMASGQFNPVNYSGAPPVQSGNYYNKQAQDAVWNQFQGMEQPLMNQQTEAQESQLQGQGLRPGDAAYDTAMKNLSNTQFQQTQSAQDQAVLAGEQEAQTMQGMDVQANQNYVGNTNAQQNQNMNILNSILGRGVTPSPTGSTSVPTSQSGVAQTPDLMGAGQNTYDAALNATNASNAGNSNMWSGILGAAGDAAMLYAFA